MGLGHVPSGPLREAGEGDDLPRRQHRGARADDRALTAGGSQSRPGRRRLGALGEGLAAEFLVAHGATILARNVRVGGGEVDLHVTFGRLVVAVEVKTLRVDDPRASDGLRSYTLRKADRVHRAAAALRPRAHRVDVVAVLVHPGGVDVRWVRAA